MAARGEPGRFELVFLRPYWKGNYFLRNHGNVGHKILPMMKNSVLVRRKQTNFSLAAGLFYFISFLAKFQYQPGIFLIENIFPTTPTNLHNRDKDNNIHGILSSFSWTESVKASCRLMFYSSQEFSDKNEEYKSKNRHNVEWFFEGVLYFGWPNQPSSGTMEDFTLSC